MMTQVESNLNNALPITQDIIVVTPPSPPDTSEMVIIPPITPKDYYKQGNFDYIKCQKSKEMIENAYKAVNQLELWHFMKKDCESYMMTSSPEINKIANKMIELGYDGHSGFTFGWTMRQIQSIAKQGEKKFMENWVKNEK